MTWPPPTVIMCFIDPVSSLRVPRATGPASAIAIVSLTIGLLVACVPLTVLSIRSGSGSDLGEWAVAAYAPGFLVSGWWLSTRRPDLRIGLIFLLAAASVALAGTAAAYAGAAHGRGWGGVGWALWVFSWIWQLHSAVIAIGIISLPAGGHLRSRSARGLAWFIGLAALLGAVYSSIRPGAVVTTPDKADGALPGIVNPLGLRSLANLVDAIDGTLLVVSLVAGLIPLVFAAVWWRRAEGHARRMFQWLTLVQIAGFLVPVLIVISPSPVGALAAITQLLATQLLIAYSIARWGAFEVKGVLRRSVVAAGVLAAGLGVYGIVVIVVAAFVGSESAIPSAAGAAVAIFAFGPLSGRIRGAVNRLFYGRRDDPYGVVADLGRVTGAATDPRAALAAVVEALTHDLRLPYAAVRDEAGVVLAASGVLEADDEPEVVELVHHGERAGTLTVGHRSGSTELTPPDSDLLTTLARQVGASVRAQELWVGLRSARERLVTAREEERRRIQRDLHDGLGPQLTALTLELDAARNHLANGEPQRADALLERCRTALRDSVTDVRRLVYSLGDPVVATLGIESAITEKVDQLTRSAGLHATVDLTASPSMTAAQEEAISLIVAEAVTNVVRHASATTCSVVLGVPAGRVEVSVSDNGIGISEQARRGIGLRSMNERAAELGGALVVEHHPTGGTVVRVTLPLSEVVGTP